MIMHIYRLIAGNSEWPVITASDATPTGMWLGKPPTMGHFKVPNCAAWWDVALLIGDQLYNYIYIYIYINKHIHTPMSDYICMCKSIH